MTHPPAAPAATCCLTQLDQLINRLEQDRASRKAENSKIDQIGQLLNEILATGVTP